MSDNGDAFVRISATDLAWAGGLFEGEGSFTTNAQHAAMAAMGMTDEDTVARFAAIFPFGKYRSYGSYRNNKPIHRWWVCNFEHTQAFVAMVWPYLGQRRRARAAEVLGIAAGTVPFAYANTKAWQTRRARYGQSGCRPKGER